ncbi:MAG TPA: copper resistance protein CopC, partial [Frankiaceae bacterium]|nr:copper resistance protein CopC [Frankiaceae bacterium]
VAAASVWIGGLAMLAVFLLRPRAAGTLAQVLPRWSRTAVSAVAALALSGAYQAWREVGTPPALPATT